MTILDEVLRKEGIKAAMKDGKPHTYPVMAQIVEYKVRMFWIKLLSVAAILVFILCVIKIFK